MPRKPILLFTDDGNNTETLLKPRMAKQGRCKDFSKRGVGGRGVGGIGGG